MPLDRLQIERLGFGKVTTGEGGAAYVGIGLLLPPLAIPPLLFVKDLLRVALRADLYFLSSFHSKFRYQPWWPYAFDVHWLALRLGSLVGNGAVDRGMSWHRQSRVCGTATGQRTSLELLLAFTSLHVYRGHRRCLKMVGMAETERFRSCHAASRCCGRPRPAGRRTPGRDLVYAFPNLTRLEGMRSVIFHHLFFELCRALGPSATAWGTYRQTKWLWLRQPVWSTWGR